MISISGNKKDIILKLEKEFDISTRDSARIISYLEEHPQYLSDNEYFKKGYKQYKETESYMQYMPNLTIGNDQIYYLNVKVITIVLIATVLDIVMMNGFANMLVSLSGMSTKAIAKLKDAHLCVVKELKTNNSPVSFDQIATICDRECVNNDIKCRFRKEGYCTISKPELKNDVVNDLVDNGVLKEENGSYKYEF